MPHGQRALDLGFGALHPPQQVFTFQLDFTVMLGLTKLTGTSISVENPVDVWIAKYQS